MYNNDRNVHFGCVHAIVALSDQWEWFRLGWKQQMVLWKKQSLLFISLSHLLGWHIIILSNSQCLVPLATKAMAKKVLSLHFLPLLLLLFFFASGILKILSSFGSNAFIFQNSAFCVSPVYMRKFWLMMILFVSRGNIEVGKWTGK